MRLCVFEDSRVSWLGPLALTRPAFDLCCGTGSLLQRQRRAVPTEDVGALVRPTLADLCRQQHPWLAVNDEQWLRRGPAVLVNGRWLPPAELLTDLTSPRVGLIEDEVAYVVLPAAAVPEWEPETVNAATENWKSTLPHCDAGGTIIRYPWDLVEHNARALCEDLPWRKAKHAQASRPQGLAVIGPEEELLMDASATVEPFVVADTRKGPVIIDRGAVVHSFSRLEGPCYIGPESWVLGAKLRGGTVGPHCRVGGEFEASILHGHSNKYHEGFLGHSYVGEWVNLAAGTQVSDLRNDYAAVTVSIHHERIPTGLTKVGAFIGDHSRTGLNTLLNTGSIIGVFCNLLPSASLLPRVVPSFCVYGHEQLTERWEPRQLFQAADTVMRRRGCSLTDAHKNLIFALYDETAAFRRRVLHDSEQRRLSRSASS